jgi:BMFP domain-containing protein YqiC
MPKRDELLSRLGKIGSEALISAVNLKREVEGEAMDRLERLAKKLKLVRREEFEVLQESIKRVRTIQDELNTRLGAIESRLGLNKSVGKKGAVKKRRTAKN